MYIKPVVPALKEHAPAEATPSRRAVLCAFGALGLSACGGGSVQDDARRPNADSSGRSHALAAGAGSAASAGAVSFNFRNYNAYGMATGDQAGVVRSAWWNNLLATAIDGETVQLDALRDNTGNPVPGMAVSWTAHAGVGIKYGLDPAAGTPAADDANLLATVFDQRDGGTSMMTITGVPYERFDLYVHVRDDGATRAGTITVNGVSRLVRGGAGNPAADGSGYVPWTDPAVPANCVGFTGLSGPLQLSFAATSISSSDVPRLKILGFQVVRAGVAPLPTAVPAAVAATVSAGNQEARLSWQPVPTATAYRIYRNGTLLTTLAASLTAYADPAVVNGTSYLYAVAAVNEAGEGMRSVAASVTPAVPPFVPATPVNPVYQYSVPVTSIYSNDSARPSDPMRRAYLWVPPARATWTAGAANTTLAYNALRETDGSVVLTRGGSQFGMLWSPAAWSTSESFTTRVEISMVGTPPQADGMALVLTAYTGSRPALSGAGGCLGLCTGTPHLAAVVRTYTNNLLGLQSAGLAGVTATARPAGFAMGTASRVTGSVTMSWDAAARVLRADYALVVDGIPSSFSDAQSIDLRAVFGDRVIAAVTAGTGAKFSSQRVTAWTASFGKARLQGVLFGLHNMLEKPLFEDPAIRQACSDAGLGIVFVSPGDAKVATPVGIGNYSMSPVAMALTLDPNEYTPTDVNPATGNAFANASEQAGAEVAELLRRLALESGYGELAHAPLMLVGHSAASPFVWTRGVHTSAALKTRVFGLLSYKGYFPGAVPQGLPILHVSSEWQEIVNWGNTWEVSDAPSMRRLRAGGTECLLGEYVQPGTGHYHHAGTQVGPIATYIRSTAAARIPADWPMTAPPVLRAVAANTGWLVGITTLGTGRAQARSHAGHLAAGLGATEAYWYPDQATAEAVVAAMNAGFSRRPQVITAYRNDTTPADLSGTANNGAGWVAWGGTLAADGVSFRLRAGGLNASPVRRLHHGGPVGVAQGPLLFKANGSGALRQTGPDMFRIWMDRGSVTRAGQPWEPFAIAWHPGDAAHREADRPVQIGNVAPVLLTAYSGGAAQTLAFADIPHQSADAITSVNLNATSSAGSAYPPQFWVVSGPYRCDDSNNALLVPADLPARGSYPIRVVVAAWQWGRPRVMQSAAPVFKTFWLFATRVQQQAWAAAGSPLDNNGRPMLA